MDGLNAQYETYVRGKHSSNDGLPFSQTAAMAAAADTTAGISAHSEGVVRSAGDSKGAAPGPSAPPAAADKQARPTADSGACRTTPSASACDAIGVPSTVSGSMPAPLHHVAQATAGTVCNVQYMPAALILHCVLATILSFDMALVGFVCMC
jgi:hypothetical protein